jgi:hypothetical protein
MTMQYTMTQQSITIIDEQKNVHTLTIGDKFRQVMDLLKAGKIQKVLTLLSPKASVEIVLKGIKIISDTTIEYAGVRYDESEYAGLIDYIIQCANTKLPYDYLLKFLDNLSMNPDKNSRLNLFKFLQQTGIKITENGYIAGVKSVEKDYKSHHDKTTLHKVGTFVSVNREKCDSDPRSACSYGLHTGGSNYVNQWSNGRRLITITHPKDVVCVPRDSSFQKMRACLYYIAGELPKDKWNIWDKEILSDAYNKIYIDFNKQVVINETKEEQNVAKSVAKQNKKAIKKQIKKGTEPKQNKCWVLKTISRNRLSLPSPIVKLIGAIPGDNIYLVLGKECFRLYKRLPKGVEEECVYKVDRDNQLCISELRLKEISNGMFFKVSVDNSSIIIQKSNGGK